MRHLHLKRKTIIQMIILTVVALTAGAVMIFSFIGLPGMLFGIGQYKVTLQLAEAGGLYPRGNVTWRGTEVGRVQSVKLTDNGVEADLTMNSDFKIPADLDAQVLSVSAVGEQYVALLPRNGSTPYLKAGDVIPACSRFPTTISRPSSTRRTPRSAVWVRRSPGSSRVRQRWPSTHVRTSTS